MKSSKPVTVARYVALILLAGVFLLPFYILVRNAFSSQAGIAAAHWHLLPDKLNLANLKELFTDSDVPVLRSLINSAVVSVLQTAGTLLVSLMAGYGLSRIANKATGPVMVLTILTLMVPPTVTFVPTFVMVSSLGWISSLRGLIIPVMFSAFATFLFRQWFTGFPKELEEAAYIDGAGYWRTFWRVVVPNAGGIIGAVGTIVFMNAWNNFLWPLLVGQDPNYRTIQVTVSAYMTSQRPDLPELFTSGMISIIPVLLVFLFLQRYLVQGVERAGIE